MVADAHLVGHFVEGGTRRPFFLDEGVIEVEHGDRARHPSDAIQGQPLHPPTLAGIESGPVRRWDTLRMHDATPPRHCFVCAKRPLGNGAGRHSLRERAGLCRTRLPVNRPAVGSGATSSPSPGGAPSDRRPREPGRGPGPLGEPSRPGAHGRGGSRNTSTASCSETGWRISIRRGAAVPGHPAGVLGRPAPRVAGPRPARRVGNEEAGHEPGHARLRLLRERLTPRRRPAFVCPWGPQKTTCCRLSSPTTGSEPASTTVTCTRTREPPTVSSCSSPGWRPAAGPSSSPAGRASGRSCWLPGCSA